MHAEEVLERYVREVAGQLPVRMRSDVSLELASLLREDLQAKAEAAGRTPDGMLALQVVRDYGHPHEVAARYHPRWAIIDPRDTRNFIMTVIVGGAILTALSVPQRLLKPESSGGPERSLLWWIGVVVVYYAWKSWQRRRRPEDERWEPRKHDPDKVNSTGLFALVALIGLSIAIFAEPQRTFDSLTGNPQLGSWLQYDPGFRAQRLPWLFAVWIGQMLMLGVVAVRGRWNPALRQVAMILSVATVVLLAWYSAAGTVMAEPVADATAKAFLAMFALLLVIDIGVRLYGQAGHVSPGKLHEALSL